MEKRRSRRQAVDVEKRRVVNPVARRRCVDIAATFKRAVVIVGVVKIDKRAGIIQARAAPIFLKELKLESV